MFRKVLALILLLMMSCVPAEAKSFNELLDDLKDKAREELQKRLAPSSSSSQPAQTQTQNQKQVITPENFYNSVEYERLKGITGNMKADLCALGDSILKYNKPVMDITLTKKERNASAVMYSRVCVKGKTIVVGNAGKDKRFYTVMILTGEPRFPDNAKNIRNGANISVIEKYVGLSAEDISTAQGVNSGIINADDTANLFGINIAYENGIITEQECHDGNALYADRVWDFIERKAQELNLILWNAL